MDTGSPVLVPPWAGMSSAASDTSEENRIAAKNAWTDRLVWSESSMQLNQGRPDVTEDNHWFIQRHRTGVQGVRAWEQEQMAAGGSRILCLNEARVGIGT